MKFSTKVKSTLAVIVSTAALILSNATPASASQYFPSGAYDLTQDVTGCASIGGAKLQQYPPHVIFTGYTIVNIWRSEFLSNGTTAAYCRQVDNAVMVNGTAVTNADSCTNCSTMQGIQTRWVLCYTTGDSYNGWNIWDKIYTRLPNGINLLGWYPDYNVTQAVTWPHC